jgi:hypothetical protein
VGFVLVELAHTGIIGVVVTTGDNGFGNSLNLLLLIASSLFLIETAAAFLAVVTAFRPTNDYSVTDTSSSSTSFIVANNDSQHSSLPTYTQPLSHDS